MPEGFLGILDVTDQGVRRTANKIGFGQGRIRISSVNAGNEFETYTGVEQALECIGVGLNQGSKLCDTERGMGEVVEDVKFDRSEHGLRAAKGFD